MNASRRATLRAVAHPALDPFQKSPSTYSKGAAEWDFSAAAVVN